jgi:hypothetical protein
MSRLRCHCHRSSFCLQSHLHMHPNVVPSSQGRRQARFSKQTTRLSWHNFAQLWPISRTYRPRSLQRAYILRLPRLASNCVLTTCPSISHELSHHQLLLNPPLPKSALSLPLPLPHRRLQRLHNELCHHRLLPNPLLIQSTPPSPCHRS